MIAIPNMEKPKSCWECRLMDGEANCLVTDEGISSKQEGIHPDCPLIDIVTCGECKHSKEWYADRCLCYLWAEEGVSVFEDGYCSYGERRANEID